jgi:transmembrane sensor
MENERIWILVASQLAGENSPEELEELDVLLKKNPDIENSMEILSALWKSKKPKNNNMAEDAFVRHLQRMARKEQDFVPCVFICK